MMKSLLDIQQEIRELDAKVKDISASIAEIYDAINEMRNDDADTIDYETIRLMALNLTFGQHPLDKLEDAYACQTYIETLLSLVHTDYGSEQTINRLIFIQWFLTQSRLNITLEELFKVSLKITSDTFEKLIEVIPKDYRNQLVLDALIIANINGQSNNDVLIYIVSLCSILAVDKDQLRILSIIAKSILRQDLAKIKKADLQQVLAQAKYFKHYLNNGLLETGYRSQRTIAVEAPDTSHSNFKWMVNQHTQVKKGDVIVTYSNNQWSKPVKEIKSPCSGTLFQFRSNCINYGVIALETDNKNSIKKWLLQRR